MIRRFHALLLFAVLCLVTVHASAQSSAPEKNSAPVAAGAGDTGLLLGVYSPNDASWDRCKMRLPDRARSGCQMSRRRSRTGKYLKS
jgi:hypothetical protein